MPWRKPVSAAVEQAAYPEPYALVPVEPPRVETSSSPDVALPTIDQWIETGSGSVEFEATKSYHTEPGRFRCHVSCKHQGNTVHAYASADSTGNAFVAALLAIEKTIGSGWRAAL